MSRSCLVNMNLPRQIPSVSNLTPSAIHMRLLDSLRGWFEGGRATPEQGYDVSGIKSGGGYWLAKLFTPPKQSTS